MSSLKDYKEIVGTAAAVTTIGQCLSPIFMCYDMYRKKSTKDIDSTPFVGGMGMSMLMLQYGLLLKDLTMIPVNIFGFSLNVIYFLIYYYYSYEKKKELVKCVKTGAIISILVAYAQLDTPERAEMSFGIIITVLMMGLIAAPLFSLGEIMRTKNTASLPFPLIASGTVVSSLWLLYGIIIENAFVQNVTALLLCSFQLSLFVIYPSRPRKDKKAE